MARRSRLPQNLTSKQAQRVLTINRLYEEAGLPRPGESGVAHYFWKGDAGIELLRKNLSRDPRSSTYVGRPTDTAPAAPDVPTTERTKYKGKNGQWGELPKRDSGGNYSWVGPDGQRYQDPEYDSSTGSWDYLDEHLPWEWESAETVFQNSPPPPKPFDRMSEAERLDYVNQAHQELAQNFVQGVRQNQSDLVYGLGQAVKTFAEDLDRNNLGIQEDVRSAQLAMEAAGLTFQGEAKRVLGEAFAGAGVLTPQQMSTLQQNLASIAALPGTAQIQGEIPGAPVPPSPPELAGPTNPQTGLPWTEDEKNAVWERFRTTPEWNAYVAQVNAMATSGTGAGIAGTGRYGFAGNLDPYAGTGILTAAGQGSLFRNIQGTGRTQLAESYREMLNNRARELGVTAERLLGTSNLTGLRYPSIGGASVFGAAPDVLGGAQTGYQTGVAAEAGRRASERLAQYGYTFQI